MSLRISKHALDLPPTIIDFSTELLVFIHRQVSPSPPNCYIAGHCRGTLGSHGPSPGAEHCLYTCKRDEDCGWWAFKGLSTHDVRTEGRGRLGRKEMLFGCDRF